MSFNLGKKSNINKKDVPNMNGFGINFRSVFYYQI